MDNALKVSKATLRLVRERWWHRLYDRWFPRRNPLVKIARVSYDIWMDPDGRYEAEPFEIDDGRSVLAEKGRFQGIL